MNKVLNNVRRITAPERSLGDWFRRIWRAADRQADPEPELCRLQKDYGSVRKAALGSGSGSIGGYLIPSGFVKDVLTAAVEESFFLRQADRVPMGSAETIVPHVAVSGGAAGQSPFFGGVSWTWTPDNAALTEDEPTFMATTLKAGTLIGFAVVSNQMMADASEGELAVYLADLLGRAAGWQVDLACFSGDGVGKPLGVINAPGRLVVSRSGAGAFTQGDSAAMAEKLIPKGWTAPGHAWWAMHPSVLLKLLAQTAWDPSSTQYNIGSPERAAEAGLPFTLLIHGLPVFVTEKLPAVGTTGDVVLFIPRLYLLGLRQEIEVAISRDESTVYFKNQSVIRVSIRADGRPRLNTSVTLADGTATASAVVVLS